VRSYQTRTYDTNDKIRVLRAVMSTLQDLRFVIDKADDTVGVVSATKLDGYALSISVSVRPSGEQMIVRANAQYNLKAIEDPGPYQDFFSALDKGLFLDNNLLVDTVVAKAMALQPATPQAADASTVSVYDFYGEAEAEIDDGSKDSDLWARALVEVEGDEQKRKARYIELRAQQLYMLSPQAQTRQVSSTSTPIVPVNTTESPSTSAGLSSDSLTGVYTDDDGGQVTIQQSGNSITGTFGKYGGTIDGTLSGNEIKYKWERKHKRNGRWLSGMGRLQVSEDGTVLKGNWWDPSSNTRHGTWKLTRLR